MTVYVVEWMNWAASAVTYVASSLEAAKERVRVVENNDHIVWTEEKRLGGGTRWASGKISDEIEYTIAPWEVR